MDFRLGAWLDGDWEQWDDDGDGLTNGEETAEYGTDPWNWDTDWDGLNDYDETRVADSALPDYTDPLNLDTDADGCSDGDEVGGGTEPNNAASVLDWCAGGVNPDNDNDYDGLANDVEEAVGTDPWNWDTDGDGCSDGIEHWSEAPSDPKDADSYQDWCSGNGGTPGDPPLMDSDGDGVADDQDICPNEPGPMENGGCPAMGSADSDMDGIPDDQDMCPNEPGPMETGGCPDRGPEDSDLDGIGDWIETELLHSVPNDATSPSVLSYDQAGLAAALVGSWAFTSPDGAFSMDLTLSGDGTYAFTAIHSEGGAPVNESETGTWAVQPDGRSIAVTTLTYDGPATDIQLGVAELLSVVFVSADTVVIDIDSYLQRQP